MKKLLIACALLASSSIYAQDKPLNNKGALNKAKAAFEASKADPKAINYQKIDEAWSLLTADETNCLTKGVAKTMPETWYYAGMIQAFYMNKMLNDRALNGGQLDYAKFFKNQADIVEFYSECDRLEHTPDAKGKMPKEQYRLLIQQTAKGARANLRIACGQSANGNPDDAIKYGDLYVKSASYTLFADEADVKLENDTNMADLSYYLATAYKTKGDTATAIQYLEKAFESSQYGKYAISELMTISRNKGDKDKARELLQLGMQKYPTEDSFAKMYLQDIMHDTDKEKTIQVADQVISMFPEDDFAYLVKGQTLYEMEKFIEAKDQFLVVADKFPDNDNGLLMAARCAWMYANRNADKKEIFKTASDDAINLFLQYKEAYPENTENWGEALYILYTNSQQPLKAKEYKQYYKQ